MIGFHRLFPSIRLALSPISASHKRKIGDLHLVISRTKSVEQIRRHSLYAEIRAAWAASVRNGTQITWRLAQSIRPPNGRRVEDVIAFRTGIDRGGVLHTLR